MSLQSDVSINVAKFDPANISEQSHKLHEGILAKYEVNPKWWEVGIAKFRQMRLAGETAAVLYPLLPHALDIKIPSREPGRDIPCRLLYPVNRRTEEERRGIKGILLHIHGGGFVLGDERSFDFLLERHAEAADLAVISIGYRLAPEYPFPMPSNDCFDVADYLVLNAEKEYGAPVKFICGESAGATLVLLTIYDLLETHLDFAFSGVILNYGCYDLTQLPASRNFTKPLLINNEIMNHFYNNYLPSHTLEQRKDPSVSAYYKDIQKFRGRLPKSLFTIGTEDPLLDDTINMSVKWMMTGGDVVVKVYTGAPHGFNQFAGVLDEADQATEDAKTFLLDCLKV
ncbi:Alpha/Beta hydrolase protein [Lipomyces starkeyi]|uniref:Alpha/beta hydrolase fold-3 domain-containing protein n=1 Tax=Lipomyces starkeyi NRRL Y-11557 TaxID=675824 RepID=A0A1E3Q6V5_LIPST|nr:hypothetical protein LIPSTDRAFT_52829 [Lipomyces starkeyi NRRL Y-11557]